MKTMRCLLVCVVVCLAFTITMFSQPGTTVVNTPRTRNVDIKHIRLQFYFDTGFISKELTAFASVTLSPLQRSGTVRLDAADLNIQYISLQNGLKLKYTCTSGDQNDNLSVLLDREYNPGENITLVVSYRISRFNETDPNATGGSNGKGIRYMYPSAADKRRKVQLWSMAEYHSNRYWFPGYDDPDDLRTTEFIAQVPDGFTVVSNGKLLYNRLVAKPGPELTGNNGNKEFIREFYFSMDKPYANHQTAFVIGQFTDVKQSYNNISLHNYSLPDEVEATKASVARLPDMVRFFSQTTGMPYPFTGYSQVFVQELPYGMDNISMSTQTENMVDDAGTHADFLYLWDALEAEALARNWFGGYINIKSWSDVWLNRSFSLYFDRLYDEYKNGKEELLLYPFFFDHATWLADWNAGIRYPVVTNKYDSEADFVSGNTTYIRGQLVLHMLRKELGDAMWWKAIRLYLKTNAGRQVTTDDFQKAVEAAAGRPMQWFFNQWIYQTGHPVFEVTKRFDKLSKQLLLTVKQVQQQDSGNIYPQTKFFEGMMQVEIDGRLRAIQIKPLAEQVFNFSYPAEPALVNFDYEHTWICEVKFQKTTRELLYQFQNSKDIVARRFALIELTGLVNEGKVTAEEKTNILQAFRKAILSTGYFRFRWTILQQMLSVATKEAGGNAIRPDKETVSMLLSLIKNESSWLKFSATGFLGATKDSAYTNIYLSNLYDKSDRVVYASAIALGKTKSSAAFEALSKLPARPSWKSQSLISSLAGLKELGDIRGYNIALNALLDVKSPRWTLVTPLWDYQIQAAQTIVALGKAKDAYPFVLERFRKSAEENNINDIFTSLYLITTLADERGQEAFDQLKIKYKDNAAAMAAVTAQEDMFHQAIKK